MKHKQTLAMLLAAAMVLSMPLGAYAQGTTEGENSTDSVQPYVVDTEAPTISKILLSDTEVNAGETIFVTVEGTDDISGISGWDVAFKGDNGEYLSSVTVHDGITKTVEIEVSEYQPSGVYHLISASVWDKAGNSRDYSANPYGDVEALPHDLSITVTNNPDKEDTQAPSISKILLSDTEVNAGETIFVTVEGTDDISGISGWDVAFKGDNGEYLSSVTVHDGITKTVEIEVSEYQPSGVYHLISASVWDKAGNSRNYSANPHGDNEALPHDLSITVINDDPVTPPTQPEGNKPSRPGSSAGNNSANSSNGSGVVNYESEKPDPADKQAVKAYNFWQDAKSKIRKTAEGKTLRLSVPKEITNLPASVMETLRKENVSLRLNWNGKTITIPAGKAQPKQKLRIYWTMQTLEKLYNA